MRPILLKLINNDNNVEEKGGSLMDQMKNNELKNEILTRRLPEIINNFSDFLKVEQYYSIN